MARTIGLIVVLSTLFLIFASLTWRPYQVQGLTALTSTLTSNSSIKDVVYDVKRPMKVGCESVVDSLRLKLIDGYSTTLKDIRYANLWGYLETENKGDAAIWAAQQMLLSTLGIQSMESCRFLNKDCDLKKFKALLQWHSPHSAIIMAGGGNFNDFYWEDQPSRMKMVKEFPGAPIRAFPQSIHMTNEERINATKESFGAHQDLELTARDAKSYAWLQGAFPKKSNVTTLLLPDIAFMWGNRPDIRGRVKPLHDVLILARDDWEISAGDSKDIPWGTGLLRSKNGNLTYNKVDWKFVHTPGIDTKLPKFISEHLKETKQSELEKSEEYLKTLAPAQEENKNVRAYAKAMAGFELLSSAKFVITDRLHGHILSTLLGIPHVVMDSKLGKNLDFVNTWTKGCECARVAKDMDEALGIARQYLGG